MERNNQQDNTDASQSGQHGRQWSDIVDYSNYSIERRFMEFMASTQAMLQQLQASVISIESNVNRLTQHVYAQADRQERLIESIDTLARQMAQREESRSTVTQQQYYPQYHPHQPTSHRLQPPEQPPQPLTTSVVTSGYDYAVEASPKELGYMTRYQPYGALLIICCQYVRKEVRASLGSQVCIDNHDLEVNMMSKVVSDICQKTNIQVPELKNNEKLVRYIGHCSQVQMKNTTKHWFRQDGGVTQVNKAFDVLSEMQQYLDVVSDCFTPQMYAYVKCGWICPVSNPGLEFRIDENTYVRHFDKQKRRGLPNWGKVALTQRRCRELLETHLRGPSQQNTPTMSVAITAIEHAASPSSSNAVSQQIARRLDVDEVSVNRASSSTRGLSPPPVLRRMARRNQ